MNHAKVRAGDDLSTILEKLLMIDNEPARYIYVVI